MRYKLPLLFLMLSALFLLMPTTPAQAFVFEIGSTTTLPLINPDNTNAQNQVVASLGDRLGNQFYLYKNVTPHVLRKVTPNGQLAWTATFPSLTYLHYQAIPDNLGGFYFIYDANVVRSNLPTVTNIFMLHYASDGTYNVQNINLLDSVFKLRIEDNYGRATVDNNGNIFIFFYESNHGDVMYKSSIKVLKVNTEGAIQNTVTTHALNPTEKRWCTNRGSGPTVPYDLPYSGGASWSACWDWCESAFSTTPGTCQYNADAVRNCWVNAFPVGGVGNCTWADFVPGYPPYSGYSGITLRQEPTVNETFYTNLPLDNVYTSFWVEETRKVSDGILIYYYLNEFDYSTTPSTNTFGKYIQKIDFSGNKMLPGYGVTITIAGTYFDDLDLIDDGYVTVESVDTNADTKNDTVRMQRYNLSGTPQFPGAGIDVFTFIEAGTAIYSYLYTDATAKIYYVIEAWNNSSPDGMTRGFVQATNVDGSVLLGADGVEIASSANEFKPEYVNEAWGDGYAGMATGMLTNGRIIPIWTYVTDGSSPLRTIRLYWASGQDEVFFEDIGGLPLEATDSHTSWCYGNNSDQIACSVFRNSGQIEQRIVALQRVNQVDLPNGFTSLDTSNSHDITAGSSYGSIDTETDIFVKLSTTVLAGATVNMSADRNWNTIIGGSGSNKAFISGLSEAAGASVPALYVPRSAEDTNLLLCPDLTTGLGDITVDCVGGIYFAPNQTTEVTFEAGPSTVTAAQVTVDAVLYWRLLGINNAGAMSGSFVVPTPTPTPTGTGTGTPTGTGTGTPTGTGTGTPTGTGTGTPTGTVTPDLTATSTLTVSPTDITTIDNRIFVQNLPPITIVDNTDVRGNSITLDNDLSCPKFTKFTLSSSIITQGEEVLVTWQTTNANRVIWNNLETNIISSGSRTILPTESMTIELVADNGKCSDIVTKRLSVVETLPWSSTTKLVAGTLIVEAVAIQLGVIQGNLWFSMAGLFTKKKKGAYGLVYNSITKLPVPRAVVRLLSADNRIIDTSVTDALGIFRLSSRGKECKIVVQSSGYSFPSTLVKGPTDGGYSSIYLGEIFSGSQSDSLSLISIPIDQVSATSIKSFMATFMNLASQYGNNFMRLLMFAGLLYSLYAAAFYPHFYNTLVLVFYVLLVAGKEYLSSRKVKVNATVRDVEGKPMVGIELGLFDTEFDTLLYRTFTSKEGSYNFAVENKDYYLKILDANYDILDGNKKTTALRIVANLRGERIKIIAEDIRIDPK